MESAEHFFDFAAEVGLTKHIGGLEATDKLAELCGIAEGKHVLDVGCGAGATPAYLVRRYGCRVVGVDISQRMVERSEELAKREGVVGQIEFRVADAQDLPFDDDLFDAVITESVTAFPADKQRAVKEYARVTKPGGYVGLNESTWLKTPPPPEVVAWASQEVGAQVKPLEREEWVGLLENAGLRELQVTIYGVDTREEAGGIVRRYGWVGMLRVFRRMVALYLRNPTYRRFVKGVREQGLTPLNLQEYFGYGLYVGRKQASE
jgi:arsenite methyltransferase